MKIIKSFTLLSLLLLVNNLSAQSVCDCSEFIYLNDTGDDGVHKYLVVGDTIQEVAGVSGIPWLPNVNNPHGIGMDLNGFLYIGDRTGDLTDVDRTLLRVTCGGEIINSDVTDAAGAGREFSTLNLEVIDNVLYSYDATGMKAWSTCTGELLESYDPETGDCNVTGVTRDDGWGLLLSSDGFFYGTRYIRDQLNGDEILVYQVIQYPADFTTWGPDCSIPLFSSDTLVNSGLSRFWGITEDPQTGNFVTVAVDNENVTSTDRVAIIFMFDRNFNLIDTLGDFTNDQTGFAGTRGITYSPGLDKFLLATQNGDCISAVRIDDTTGELELCEPLIPFISGSQGKGIDVVNECCPSTAVQEIETTICVTDPDEPNFLSNVYGCDSPVCGGEWVLDDGPANLTYESCSQSITFTGDSACADFSRASNSASPDGCGAFNITLTACFVVQPDSPVISVTDNTCEPAVDGSINVDTPCGASSTIEFSTDGGVSWSTTAPAYNPNAAISVMARCTLDGCSSTETVSITTSPEICDPCPPVNCIGEYGGIAIQKNTP